jgi:hypothetical protein
MENKDNLVIKIDSEENSKKSEEKTNSILINDDKESKNINYSNINSENINIKEEKNENKNEIKNDELKEENILIKLKNWFLSKSVKFKLILIISSVILLSLLLTLIIVLSKKHSNSSIKKDSDNLNINNNLSKRVGEDGEELNEGNDEFGYHILLHEVSEMTGPITITQKSLTNVAFYTRKVKAITDYMVVNVNINIPLTGNNIAGQYSRIITYFDNEVICDSTIYNSDAWELKPLTINGYVKNVRQGEHTITVKAAVSAGTLLIPHFDSNSVAETIKPRIQYSYFIAGYV